MPGRRAFLARLGATLFGAGAVALVGCGDRPMSTDGMPGEEDHIVYGGVPDRMNLPRDAGVDTPRSTDGDPGEQDYSVTSGIPDAMPRYPDSAGTAPMPDAEID